MNKKTFTVPGEPCGYYAQAARSIWKMSPKQRERAQKYRSYQEKVILYARQAGITVPLKASSENCLSINTAAYFSDGRFCDPENVRKGITDALFKGAGKADRWTGGAFSVPMFDKATPRVEVEILELEDRRCQD